MRKLIGTGLFLLFFSGYSYGAIAFVQSKSGDAGTVTSTDVVVNVSTGNYMQWAVRTGGTSLVAVTITDGYNTYATDISSFATGPSTLYLGHAFNIIGGSQKVHIALDSSQSLRYAFSEVSGADTTSPIDQTSGNSAVSSSPDSGSRTSTTANELIFGACDSGLGLTDTPGGTYTGREQVPAAPNTKLSTEDKTVSATGSYSADFTISTPDTWIVGMVMIKQAAATGRTRRVIIIN